MGGKPRKKATLLHVWEPCGYNRKCTTCGRVSLGPFNPITGDGPFDWYADPVCPGKPR